MSLVVRYYSGCRLQSSEIHRRYQCPEGHVIVRPSGPLSGELREGVYSYTSTNGFSVGGSCTLSRWLSQLDLFRKEVGDPGDRIAHWPAELSFKPLLDLPDYEGTIDWKSSTRLYLDFLDYDRYAEDWGETHGGFYARYLDWMHAFGSAAFRGFVCFL